MNPSEIPEILQIQEQGQQMRRVSRAEALAEADRLEADLVLSAAPLDPPLYKLQPRPRPPLSMEELPQPLAAVHRKYLEEKDPFRRIHRLIDTMETFVKIHTVFVMNLYFDTVLRDVSSEIKGMLAAGLKTPSLGIWWWFTKEFAAALASRAEKHPLHGMTAFVTGKGALAQAMDGDDNFINLRNSYAHGATPPDERCLEDLKAYGPRLERLIQSAFHFRKILLRSNQADGGQCFLEMDGRAVSLHPLLVFDTEKKHYLFYNDFRSDAVSLLNYEHSLHEKRRELNDAFLSRFPLHDWSRAGGVENFKERVEFLTELFKGRTEELSKIGDFILKQPRGFLFFWGPPGIGKSALLARASQVYRWSPELREAHGIKIDGELKKLHVLEYFIRRDMGTNDAGKMFDNLNIRLEAEFKTGIPTGGDVKTQETSLRNRLRNISSTLKESEKLLLIIDGLDEASEDPVLLDLLPREVPDRVQILYASRDHEGVRAGVYEKLEREVRSQLTLGGFSAVDTRAFLYDYVDKYALEKEFVEAVTAKSQGNPLYIKLLCQGLEKNDYQLNSTRDLPAGMNELYDVLFRRLARTPGATDFLRLLAAGKDYFSVSMIRAPGLMNLHVDDAESIVRTCMEVLIENPLTQNVDDYQLFHESLREYILQKYPEEVQAWRDRLTAWCADYANASGDHRVYALKYLIPHWFDSYDRLLHADPAAADVTLQKIIATLKDGDFRLAQFQSAGNAIGLQSAVRRVTRTLIVLDTKAASPAEKFKRSADVFYFAHLMHREPEVIFEKQKTSLQTEAQQGRWESVGQIAAMGSTMQDKVMLALLGVARSGRNLRADQTAAFKETTEAWLKAANNDALRKLAGKLMG